MSGTPDAHQSHAGSQDGSVTQAGGGSNNRGSVDASALSASLLQEQQNQDLRSREQPSPSSEVREGSQAAAPAARERIASEEAEVPEIPSGSSRPRRAAQRASEAAAAANSDSPIIDRDFGYDTPYDQLNAKEKGKRTREVNKRLKDAGKAARGTGKAAPGRKRSATDTPTTPAPKRSKHNKRTGAASSSKAKRKVGKNTAVKMARERLEKRWPAGGL
jgi:hypothetical protein